MNGFWIGPDGMYYPVPAGTTPEQAQAMYDQSMAPKGEPSLAPQPAPAPTPTPPRPSSLQPAAGAAPSWLTNPAQRPAVTPPSQPAQVPAQTPTGGYEVWVGGQPYQITNASSPEDATARATRLSQGLSEVAGPPTNFASGPLQTMAHGATFGLVDEARGLIGGIGSAFTPEGFGPGYEQARDTSRAEMASYREQEPVWSTVADIAGGLGTGLGAAKAGLSAVRGAQPTVRGMTTAGAVDGAVYGAGYGFGSGEGSVWDRLGNAAMGTTTGALAGQAGGALMGRLAGRAKLNAAPGAAVMGENARGLFRQVEQSGFALNPGERGNLYNTLANAARPSVNQVPVRGSLPPAMGPPTLANATTFTAPRSGSAPLTEGVMRDLRDHLMARGTGAFTIKEMMEAGQIISANSRAFRDEPQTMYALKGAFEDFLQNINSQQLSPGSFPAAQTPEVMSGWQNANKAWGEFRRAEEIEDAFVRGITNAGPRRFLPGVALDAVRNELRTIVNNPRIFNRYPPELQSLMTEAVSGSGTEASLRAIEGLIPGASTVLGPVGGGYALSAAQGAPGEFSALGAAAGAIPSVAGSAARTLGKDSVSRLRWGAVQPGIDRGLEGGSDLPSAIIQSLIRGGGVAGGQNGQEGRQAGEALIQLLMGSR